jgi:hypothetical protein
MTRLRLSIPAFLALGWWRPVFVDDWPVQRWVQPPREAGLP